MRIEDHMMRLKRSYGAVQQFSQESSKDLTSRRSA
jgi:hypothetical protein